MEDSRFRKVPIAQLKGSGFDKGDMFVSLMEALGINMELMKIMQYGYTEDKLHLFGDEIPRYISPTITYHQKEYTINGIDIIESFDKYQESLYGEYINNETFGDVLDIEELDEVYYIPLLYYINQVGDAEKFPIACEIALMADFIGDIRDEYDWKKNSPAWRFCKVVKLIKEDKSMPHIQSDRIHETYSEIVDYISKKCGFKNYRNIYKELHTEINTEWSDPLINEMNLALDFKLQYPGILAYPFLCDEESVDKLNMFEPHFLGYTDVSMPIYYRDNILYGKVGGNKHKWKSALSVELHHKALAYQIMGRRLGRTIDYDVLLCGCGYFGISDCPYYNRVCNGWLKKDSELKYSVDSIRNEKALMGIIQKERRDNNIENYNKYLEKHNQTIERSCPLDAMFVTCYGFSITDISVDFRNMGT